MERRPKLANSFTHGNVARPARAAFRPPRYAAAAASKQVSESAARRPCILAELILEVLPSLRLCPR